MNTLLNMKDDLEALEGASIKTTTLFTEPCKKCAGRGKFVGYTGRVVGNCFSCGGKGFHEFKTFPQYREKAAVQRQNSAARKQEELQSQIDAFGVAHAEEIVWIGLNSSKFEFAQSLAQALNKFGSLTENQLAAVRRCIERDNIRTAERAVEKAARIEAAPVIDISKIEVSFAKAIEAGIKRPKLRLADFRFSPAPVTGNNAGAIYVKAGETYLGKIAGGKLFKSRECDDQTEGNILAAAADPEAAAVAYGRRFGQCAICSRELTNQESIDRGIGPICADRFGW